MEGLLPYRQLDIMDVDSCSTLRSASLVAATIRSSGKREVTKVKIDPDAVDPDDVEMLEDLIVAATNEALRKVEQESTSMMSKLTGGMGMGGGLPF